MSNNVMNDTVMKAHQNRDMTYDEMNDLWNVNEAAHPARGNLLSIYGIINDFTVQCSTSVISVQVLQFILVVHGFLPLLEGRHLAYQTRSEEAYGAVNFTSGSLSHQGGRFLTKECR